MYRKLYKKHKGFENSPKPSGITKILVIAPMVTFYSHCKHCMMLFDEADLRMHQKTFQEYPPEWQEDYHRMGKLLEGLWRKFPQRLEVELVDPQTPLGLYKSLRYGITKYPTFVLDGKKKITGWQEEELYEALEALMREKTAPLLSPQTL